MKYRMIPGVLLTFVTVVPVQSAVSVKTSIELLAEISTSVSIFVDSRDVTNSSFNLKLEDVAGYMTATTPAFQFIGNASSVSLSLSGPGNNELTSENNDRMRLNTTWVRVDGGESSTSFGYNNLPVYPSLSDVPDLQKGVKVRFISSQRTETYPLGSYSGTFNVIVTPSV